MEEEIIIIVKPPRQQNIAADLSSMDSAQATTVQTFSNRADAIAYLANSEATDDRA